MLPFVTDSSRDEHFPKFPAYSEKEISRGKIAAAFVVHGSRSRCFPLDIY